MPQNEYRVTISIQRSAISLDGKGGHIKTWPPSGGQILYYGYAFKHFYSEKNNRGQTDEQGAGFQTARQLFYEIRAPLPPTIKPGDRIVDSDGETVNVKLPERRYGRKNLQIDVERIRIN